MENNKHHTNITGNLIEVIHNLSLDISTLKHIVNSFDTELNELKKILDNSKKPN